MSDLIERQDALDAIDKAFERSNQLNAYIRAFMMNAISEVKKLPSAQQDIEEKLYQYKCYITDKEDLQHEVIHTGDIRRATGWKI